MRPQVIFILIFASSCATIPASFSADDDVSKTVDDLTGSKNQLYAKATEWLITYFGSAESVIQYADKEDGIIIGKYVLRSVAVQGTSKAYELFATITIQVMDNKARIDIRPYGYWEYVHPSQVPQYTKERAKNDLEVTATSFAQFIRNPMEF
jgi:hypothetical protein